MYLKSELGASQNECSRFSRTYICKQQSVGFLGDPLRIAYEICIRYVLPTSCSLIPERVRIGTHLNFSVIDGCCGNRATALIHDLLEQSPVRVTKDFVILDSDDIALGNLHSRIPPHDGIGRKEQLQFLLQRNGKGIDVNGRRVATNRLYRITELDAFSGDYAAGICDLHRESGDPFDLRLVQIGAGRESPRIVHEHADAEALTVLVAKTIDVAVLHTHHLLTPIDDADICISSPLQLCDVQRMINKLFHGTIVLTIRMSVDNLGLRLSILCTSK